MRRTQQWLALGLLASSAGAALAACGSSSDNLCEFSATCGGNGGADGGGDVTVTDGRAGADGGGGDAPDALPDTAPPGCDPGADPKDAPACVTDAYGIFVSPAGSDSAAGTMAAPVQTLATALTKTDAAHPRIYVCATAGDFKEQVSVTAANDGVGIYGGWDCSQATWPSTGADGGKPTPSKLDPAKGVALKLAGTANGVTVEDLQIEGSADNLVPGDSAVAVFVSNAKATFKRVALVAHDGTAGKTGPDGVDAAPNWSGTPTTGKNSIANNGGAQVDCTCIDGTASHGGAGGGQNGGGSPGFSSPDAGLGIPGGFSSGSCSGAQTGPNGAIAAQAVGATTNGTLDATGWRSSTALGQSGGNATPASGGGGGGGDGAGGGGGGGCGGCGGAGGKPGTTGGSSFALLVFQASASPTVSVLQSSLQSGQGGSGGPGGKGQAGQAGGGAGSGRCGGGLGGNGPGGGGGGGGAGGISTALAYHGTEPTLDGPSQAASMAGPKGTFGAGGTGGVGGFQSRGDTQAATGATGVAGADGSSQAKLNVP